LDIKFSTEKWLPSLILSLGMVVSSLVVSSTLYKIKRMDNTITVTGSAKTRVISDQVRWTISISRISPTLSEGYSQMAKDLSKIKEFLNKNGIQEKEVEVTQIYTSQPWLYTERADRMYYQFNQSIIVSSMEVDKVLSVAEKIYSLVPEGVNITASNLEFYYSKLPELRVSLLNDAMIDAKQRATMIAKSTGRKVGKVKSAKMGVVQVMAPNTIQISDYGTYNTESREKEVMITVQATFYLK
jgi:hypothetical protein